MVSFAPYGIFHIFHYFLLDLQVSGFKPPLSPKRQDILWLVKTQGFVSLFDIHKDSMNFEDYQIEYL